MTPEKQSGQVSPNTIGYFDAFAESGWYDKDAAAEGWPQIATKLAAKIFEYKDAATTRSLLELGVGSGIFLEAVMQHAPADRIVAVDGSPQMLDLLRQKDIASDIAIIEARAEDYLAHCNEMFDLISSGRALEFMPELPKALDGVAKLLNKDGVTAFTYVPLKDGQAREKIYDDTAKIGQIMVEHRWLPEEIEQPLADGSLKVVEHTSCTTLRDIDQVEIAYNFILAAKI